MNRSIQVDTTNMEAFYILEGSYIDASLQEINKKYGSVLNYAKERLKLTDQEISELKAILLEKPTNDEQQK